MNVITAPFGVPEFSNKPKIFLAGCANTEWRKEFVEYFKDKDVILYDPKRSDWNLMDKSATIEQITWEYQHLNNADIIVFWFNGGSVCPITLLEFGEWGLARGTPMTVGVSNDYEKRTDIYVQTILAKPTTRIVDSIEELVYETKAILDKIERNKNRDLEKIKQ